MEKFLDFIVRAGSLDRRVIFVVIALAVLLPLFFPLGLPIRATNSSQAVYDGVEELNPGDKALISFEYGPSTKPEIHPMTVALLRHLFDRGVKVYITCLWPDGQFMAMEALEQVAEDQYGKVYGEDFVLLGYRPGAEAVIKGLVSNIRKVFTVDSRGNFLDDIPMMADVNQVADFDYLFSASAGYPGTVEWVQYAADPTGVTMSTGTTSIQVNEVMPYVQSGQLRGILGGMPGAAEYESLIGQAGIGTSGMDAQSVAHVIIVAFIIFGNISFFIERRRSKKY